MGSGRTLEGRACGGCGGPINRPAGSRGPLALYCGDRCRWKAGHGRDRDRRAKLRTALTCEGCGMAFDSGRWRRRFCTPSCRRRAWLTRRVRERAAEPAG